MTLLQHRTDGPERGEPLVLGPSLGTSARVWEPQLAALARTFRVIRFDLPGHGGSPPADVRTVDDLAGLVLELADALSLESFHYAGVSLGGAIGATLAARRPTRLRSLAMLCSSARFGEPQAWRERAGLVRDRGTGPLLEATARRWFAGPADRALLDDLAGADPAGYAACCDALAGYDLRDRLADIAVPTLVVAGRDDPATPPAHARRLADGIPGATLVEVAAAAHLANVDRPEPVTAALLAHLPAEPGMKVRREVLGDAHVDRAIARTTGFTWDFQDLITRYAWGEIWTRPGLDRRTRSCVTLTALVAHGHLEELAMHVRAALRNGLTPDEIGEVLLQTAIYCGVPAANAAFAVAQRVLAETSGE
ncbi:3-oxoadipate enol-lactonase/4-carboxymuconolactone decarboxylase [Streptosporangium becharense]|uniref:3-oxoadipate enol-lactonase/4-carboxymuconolactone decarboxylase n=1 Tax=Streptosporangium becharense TaxID=1816182 RepID=A0A7W9IMH3_9ACTN|nr:4-carboxymuconolactone decarboxylase [Streptosporangium becharense]MBB2910283.1 3-oxoadipate enol-lactonase/4-carboxymuconolactone decarboxylase [Streptosporangium becharense]MBB5823026.1 3-oxoadipate enol-lactonase/4-carboxymuconolactone decarboxylase [Streptosporangium becharense]